MHNHDVIVVGGGGAGLRAAIAADEAGADVAIVSKLHPVRSHTGAAEGGVNAALHPDDAVEDHAYETMKGADYLADAPAVETFAETIPEEVTRLEHWGMGFSRTEDGRIAQRPFGGMAFPRTAYAGAETGHHLLHTMYEQAVKRGIEVYDEWYVTRLVVSGEANPADRTCHGVVAFDLQTGELAGFRATGGVVLATGGAGQVFEHTTNAVANTGDGMAMAYRAGVPLEDMEFIQFHPTTLPSTGVLITEGVRGEGGRLFNADGERFMFERGYANNAGELASRDVVSRAELTEVDEGRGIEDDHVFLDMRHLGAERIRDRLENIVHLAEDFEGVDALAEPMPVKPGAHYTMGGIEVDENGRTCIDGLYAAGECGCVSMHGANRLGGNSLAELLVFGKRAGRHAAGDNLEPADIETGKPEVYEEGEVDVPVDLGAADGETAVADGGPGAGAGTGLEPAETIDRAVERDRERIERLLEREDGTDPATIRAAVQDAMGKYVNVFREEAGIEQALRELRTARDRYRDVAVDDPSRTFNTDLVHALELRNLIDVAKAIAVGALARTEFRGAHWRAAHRERKDEEWLKHTMLSWNDGSPELWYRPVILEGEMRTYEPTARSY
ncbi:succinate dehydrogenase [Halobiforma lacisalsi AJ5]|uniref:succinate dehydrogenase n=1 Tax=Natronobacterium lacisalsi AJ5 TaxID=358396 RepID=M0LSJ0_NATLA|nr:FAD-binding protein [Halobiforma lacisalsi]APW96779.1 succinate dehydrogenase [Halobiforma lacisalsi AJ5]EMA35050.1 succinate dehydrogenase or fumarate reductase, flavoprotein subunit [Halobiforma lacisalsi AJ5]